MRNRRELFILAIAILIIFISKENLTFYIHLKYNMYMKCQEAMP